MRDEMVKLAAGYVRCSTDEQGATSIPQQKEELVKFAKLNNYHIIKWFVDEGKSGTSFEKRSGFMVMKNEVENHPSFHYVLVYDESRWGRAINPRENNYYRTHFEMRNVKVRMMHSSSRNEDDIGSYVVEVVESAEASEYSKKLSRSVRRGMLADQQGKYSRGGTAPYGYKRIAIDMQTGEKKELRDGLRSVPRQEKVVWELGNPLEVETIKLIFELRAEGIGYVGIADRLNSQNVPCPKRGRWKNKDQKWCGSTIIGIVENPVYMGERIYNRLSFSKIVAKEKRLDINLRGERVKIHNDQSEWKIIPDAHPAIVSKKLFADANRNHRPKREARVNQHFYKSEYLLTGLIKCKYCGFNFQGYHHTQTKHRYYVDGGYVNKGKSVCGSYSIRQDILEPFVLDNIKDIFQSSNSRKQIEDYLDQFIKSAPEETLREESLIAAQMQDTESSINNLLIVAEKGLYTESIINRMKELEKQNQDLRIKYEAIKGQNKQNGLRGLDKQTVVQMVCKFIDNFTENFANVSTIERKEMIRQVVDTIIIDKKEGKAHCFFKHLPGVEFEGSKKVENETLGVQTVALTGIEPVLPP